MNDFAYQPKKRLPRQRPATTTSRAELLQLRAGGKTLVRRWRRRSRARRWRRAPPRRRRRAPSRWRGRRGRAGEAAAGGLAEVAAVPIPEEVAHRGAVVEAVDRRARTDYAAEAAQSRF